jgi:subtilisin family serine protease
LKTKPNADPIALAARMSADPRIQFAEPNYLGEMVEGTPSNIGAWGGTDPAPYFTQYVTDMLGLVRAQQISRGNGVVVAILDTGIQMNHPQLADSLTRKSYDFVAGDNLPDEEANGLDDDGDGRIDEALGHGTHIAGIVHLVAPDAKLLLLRVLDTDGRGDLFNIASAIDYAVSNEAKVINLSLGTSTQSSLLKEVIREANRAGVVVVTAAGNLNSTDTQYPAADACAIGVASVGPADSKSSFSSYGNWVDIAAPGESIYSTYVNSGFAWWSGTSMAAPFVAGQVALIRSASPSLGVLDVAALVAGTTRSLNTTDPAYSRNLGAGRIQIGSSLEYLQSNGVPAIQQNLIAQSCIN